MSLSKSAAGKRGRAAAEALFMRGSRRFPRTPGERVGLVVEVARGADVVARAGVLAGNGHGVSPADVLAYALLLGLARLECETAPSSEFEPGGMRRPVARRSAGPVFGF